MTLGRSSRRVLAVLLPLLSVAVLSLLALAQAAGPFDLSWSTVDGGGTMPLAGGTFSLSGTGGQPDAAAAAGGALRVEGGFWPGLAPPAALHRVHLPVVLR